MNESAVKERPILFNSAMVRPVFDGSKTQTRRVINPQPKLDADQSEEMMREAWAAGFINVKCPYGKVGDLLWVREPQKVFAILRSGKHLEGIHVRYLADETISKKIIYPNRLKEVPAVGKGLSNGGFRESSRIRLEITNIRVERVQEMSCGDAEAEGLSPLLTEGSALCQFPPLWDSINSKRGYGWDKNPWVWVVEFKRVSNG